MKVIKPLLVSCAFIAIITTGGCGSKPALTQSGFLSDYSRLEPVPGNANRIHWISPELSSYTAVMIDPIEVQIDEGVLSEEERAEAVRYLRQRIEDVLEERGVDVVSEPGVRVSRLQIALTAVTKATPWKKIHPGAKLFGAGRGGAAMEMEVIDSITGRQLGAAVQVGIGSQFNLGSFSTLADVKGAIDSWAVTARENIIRLQSARESSDG